MEEPKHRRRVRQALPELQEQPEHREQSVRREPQQTAEPDTTLSAPPRRRRVQQVMPEQQVQPERRVQPEYRVQPERREQPEYRVQPERRVQPEYRVQPERREQPERRVQPERQAGLPQAKRIVPAAPNKKRKKKKIDFSWNWAEIALGAAALLSMAGAWIVHALKQLGPVLRSLKAQYASRGGKNSAGKAAMTKELLRLAAMAACVCLAVFSAWQVGSILLRSVRTNRLNDSLAQQRAAIIDARQETAQDVEASFVVYEPTAEPVVFAPAVEPVIYVDEIPFTQEPQSTVMPAATRAPDAVRTTKYRRVGGDALPEMAAMYEQNHDLVAWIQIPEVLDLPVVYRDNDYYLTRDFSKQKNSSGTIFLDKNHPFKEKTQNLLLHGHNMKDGTMFGRLAQYLYDGSYLRNHPFINFDTLWHKEQYVIFAVLNVSLTPSDSRFLNYFTHDTFSSDSQFSGYIRQLQLRSEYAIPIDVEPTDALLTLSTCLDEDRLVIVARRLREDETRSDLRALIRMATKQ